MGHGHTIYENDIVHLQLRSRVAKLSSLTIGTIVASLLLFLLQERWVALPMWGAGLALVGLWSGTLWWTWRQLNQLRHVAWCVKISGDEVIGYDYARRRTPLSWSDVQGIDLTEESLRIMGQESWFEVPDQFDDFPSLSHDLTRLAEDKGIPIQIEGQPWQHMDVYALYPFLVTDPPEGASGLMRDL